MDAHRQIQSYGVDSLLAFELKNWIAKESLASMALFETQGGSTFFGSGNVVYGMECGWAS